MQLTVLTAYEKEHLAERQPLPDADREAHDSGATAHGFRRTP